MKVKKRPKHFVDYAWLPKILARYGITDGSWLDAYLDLLDESPEIDEKYKRPGILAASLGALQFPFVHESRVAADIGTGFGHPGLALACLLPDTNYHLIEPQPARHEWLEWAVRELGLENAHVIPHGAERWGRQSCDLVTIKNVAALNTSLEWAAPLLCVGGRAVVWMRRFERGEERSDGLHAASILGLEIDQRRLAHKLTHDGGRLLVVLQKTRETPAEFPRGPKEAWRDPITSEWIV